MENAEGVADSRARTGAHAGAKPLTRPPLARDSKAVPTGPPHGARLTRLLEALLFIGGEPVRPARFVKRFPGLSASVVEAALQRLMLRYRRQHRPYAIFRQADSDGYVLRLLPSWIETLQSLTQGERGVRLSRRVLEILSVIAYRQPIARPDIEAMFGGADARPVLRQLAKRGLVSVKPHSVNEEYITTARFLDLFGLAELGDLPSTEDLQQL